MSLSSAKKFNFQLEGFKGVRLATVPIEDLAVLAGPNSSGKSSFLQSLLLLAQSEVESLNANGEVVLLGNARELSNRADRERRTYFRFAFPANPLMHRARRFHFRPPSFRDVKGFDWKEILDSGEASQAETELEYGVDIYDTTRLNLQRMVVNLDRDKSAFAPGEIQLRLVHSLDWLDLSTASKAAGASGDQEDSDSDLKQAGYFYEVTTSKASDIRSFIRIENSRIADAFCVLSVEELLKLLVVPTEGIDKQDIDRVSSTLQVLVGSDSFAEKGRVFRSRITNRREDSLYEIENLLQAALDGVAEPTDPTVGSTIRAYLDATAGESDYLVLPLLGDAAASLKTELLPLVRSVAIVRAVLASIAELANRIRYIGPLRAEAKPAYGVEVNSRTTPLGITGGSTASFLDSVRAAASRAGAWSEARRESAISPQEILDGIESDLISIGAGERVLSFARGKIGYELQVENEHGTWNVTDLGTGVSQVLPILVLLNSSPPGSVVVIEQPEVHLHPAMQSRIGDVLLRHANDKSLIVETHSDYLMNRLRLRILESNISPAVHGQLPNVSFLWSQLAADELGFTISPLALDTYGDLAQWPAGFFDSTENDIDRILHAKIQLARSFNEAL